jgi:hypothetical protein
VDFDRHEVLTATAWAARARRRIDADWIRLIGSPGQYHCDGKGQEQSPAHFQTFLAVTVSQKPVMPHLHEASGQHVLHEASQELSGRESHGLLAMIV